VSDEPGPSIVNGHEPSLVRDRDGQRDSAAGAGEYASFHCETYVRLMCGVNSQFSSNGTV